MSLREFLVQCPEKYLYDTSKIKEMRAGLRRRLFREATADNKYIHWLFDNEDDVLNPKPAEWLRDACRSHKNRPCVRSLRQGEPAYRCNTCSLDDTCVLCQYCYTAEDHIGHDVFMRITHRNETGICDCGDPEAWKDRNLRCAASENHDDSGEVPAELVSALSRTVSEALDFVLDISAASHPGVQFMNTRDEIFQNFVESNLDPQVYGVPEITGDGMYTLCLWNDERRSFLDAALAIKLATQKTHEFGAMVAQRIDSYGRGLIKVSSNIDELLRIKRSINLFTCTIRSTRDYMREEMLDEIIHWLVDLSWAHPRSGPTITFRHIVGEALCKPWTVGNAHMRAGNSVSDDMEFPTDLWHNAMLNGDTIARLEDRSEVMRAAAKKMKKDHPDNTNPTAEDTFEFDDSGLTFSAISSESIWVHDEKNLAAVKETQLKPLSPQYTHRFQYLLFFDIRYWKSLRNCLQELYVSALIGNPEFKMTLGIEYANMYPQIAELYVLLDREPEVSCIQSLSIQLFTTPSIATELLTTSYYFSQYLASLYTLLTLQRIGPLSCITDNLKLDVDAPILKNRRFGQLFHELTFLLSRNINKKSISSNPKSLMQVADFLSLCQGLSPVKRQTEKHIEFESESWVFVFTTVPFVLQLGQGVAQSAYDCKFEETQPAITGVADLLLKWAFQYMSKVQNNSIGSINCRAEFAGKEVQCTLSNYDTTEGIVSLHHPVHTFLSFLLQNCHVDSRESLQKVIFSGAKDLMGLGFDEQFVRSMLFEHPIQSIAILSQIRIGLWVRNGYTMRSQLHHYRETTLRELAYAQDLFMAQTALVALDTNTAFIQLVQRWSLADWETSKVFDESQRYYILEEFLHILDTLLVDRIYLQDKSKEEVDDEYFRRELVQTLVFKDMSYSEIGRNVPEPMTGEDGFELVLKACANFTPPKGVNGLGSYSLKPELYEEFNPHYTHFSSARIEEAENAIASRLADYHKCSIKDIVHMAPLKRVDGPWADLGAFTRCVSFAAFMTSLVNNLVNTKSQKHQADAETALNSALYLLLMAAKDDLVRDHSKSVQDEGVFSSLREWIVAENEGTSMYKILENILELPHLSAVHIRVRKLFELLDAESLESSSVIGTGSLNDSINAEDTSKKEKGKQARAKVMEELRRQQEQFQKANEDEGDDPMTGQDVEQDEELGWSFAKSNCVLCHIPDNGTTIFGQMMFTSPVSILRGHDDTWAEDGYGTASDLDQGESIRSNDYKENEWWNKYTCPDDDTSLGKAYPADKVKTSVTISGCGHNVHYACYKDYITYQRSRPDHANAMRLTGDESRRGEYLCPLCRGLNNSFIPICWSTNKSPACEVLGECKTEDLELIQHFDQLGKLPTLLTPAAVPTGFTTDRYFSPPPGSAPAMNEELKHAFSEQVYRIDTVLETTHKVDDNLKNRGIYPVFADTIRCMEIALRGCKNPSPYGGIILDQLSGKNIKNLRLVGHYMATVHANSCYDNPMAVDILDPFENFVTCMFWVCPTYGISPVMGLRWSYVLSILQQVLSIRSNSWTLPKYAEAGEDVIALMRGAVIGDVDPASAYSMIARNVTIFLRRAALVVHSLAGLYDEDDFKFMTDKPEHERLCLYLGLPTLKEMFVNLADPNSSDSKLANIYGDASKLPMAPIEYPGVYSLVKLPPRLDFFFNMRDNTKDFPLDPAVCLFCGTVVQFQCPITGFHERGKCTKHIDECSKFYGMYILPRRNALYLATSNKRGSFSETPYLDMHGEPDETMRRGRAHFLHPVRWENTCRKLWLENEIFDAIVRRLDQNIDFGGWETI